jgi:hypothetical protein
MSPAETLFLEFSVKADAATAARIRMLAKFERSRSKLLLYLPGKNK